jgi:hypothetical protein
MARESFYEIDMPAYLFGNGLPTNEHRNQPEEMVRQWCAYELLRAYGVKISEIVFEHPVKVGSKNYRIDILVSRRSAPALVVECKPRDFTKHAEAMAQAISYADAQNIRAEFALYTNGDAWHVKRRIRDHWVPVTDLPQQVDRNGTESITELLRALAALNPLLCKLGETLTGQDASTFMDLLQEFFYGTNLLTEDIDADLRFAMDNLLRCLSSAGNEHYQAGKFAIAQNSFEKYRKQADIGSEMMPGGSSLWTEMKHLYAELMSIVEGTKGDALGDLLVLRLATALVDYGRLLVKVKKPKSYPPIGPSLHEPLRDYLNYALTVHLNVSLPDPLDNIWNGDVRRYCLPAWKARAGEP